MADNVLSLILRARDEATANVKKVSQGFDELGRSAKGAHGSASMLSSVLSGIGAGVGIVGVMGVANATAKMADILGDATRAAMEDEASIRKLTTTLRENAPAWSGSLTAVERFVRSGQQLAFTDDAIRESIGKLTVATGDVGRAMDLTRLSMDLARLRNIDLASASDMVNKAVGGQIGALRRVLPFIDKNATSTQALAAIQQAAQGQAESYAATTEGSVLRSQIALDEALEKLGYVTMPVVAEAASTLADAVEAGIPVIEDAADALGLLIDALAFSAQGYADLAAATTVSENPARDFYAATRLNDAATRDFATALAIATANAAPYSSQLHYIEGESNKAATSTDTLAEAEKAAAAAAWIAAANSATAINAFVNQGRAALWAAEKIDILSDASAGADMTARIAASGAWTATTAYYAQAAGLDRAGLGLSRAKDKVKDYATATERATGSTRSFVSAAEKLASKLQREVSDAFERFKEAALDALDAAHDKALQAIRDQQRLADAAYDAARALIQGPVDRARAELDAARAARALADAQQDLADAYASGDAAAIQSAQRRLADIQAEQAIDAMQREADAKLAALDEEKRAKDAALSDAEKAENLTYEQKKAAMEADLELIEETLAGLEEKYEGRTQDLINVLWTYKDDFVTLGQALGMSYADGFVVGLDVLIPRIAQKVAELLGIKLPAGFVPVPPAMPAVPAVPPTTPPGRASGGPVSAWQPYIVGELGPELFVPRVRGTIVPGGGTSVGGTVNVNVSISGPAIFDPLGVGAQQVAAAMLPALRREVARQGVTL